MKCLRLLFLVFPIQVFASQAGAIRFIGVVKSFDEKSVIIESNGQQYELPKSTLKKAPKAGKVVEIPMSEQDLKDLKPKSKK